MTDLSVESPTIEKSPRTTAALNVRYNSTPIIQKSVAAILRNMQYSSMETPSSSITPKMPQFPRCTGLKVRRLKPEDSMGVNGTLKSPGIPQDVPSASIPRSTRHLYNMESPRLTWLKDENTTTVENSQRYVATLESIPENHTVPTSPTMVREFSQSTPLTDMSMTLRNNNSAIKSAVISEVTPSASNVPRGPQEHQKIASVTPIVDQEEQQLAVKKEVQKLISEVQKKKESLVEASKLADEEMETLQEVTKVVNAKMASFQGAGAESTLETVKHVRFCEEIEEFADVIEEDDVQEEEMEPEVQEESEARAKVQVEEQPKVQQKAYPNTQQQVPQNLQQRAQQTNQEQAGKTPPSSKVEYNKDFVVFKFCNDIITSIEAVALTIIGLFRYAASLIIPALNISINTTLNSILSMIQLMYLFQFVVFISPTWVTSQIASIFNFADPLNQEEFTNSLAQYSMSFHTHMTLIYSVVTLGMSLKLINGRPYDGPRPRTMRFPYTRKFSDSLDLYMDTLAKSSDMQFYSLCMFLRLYFGGHFAADFNFDPIFLYAFIICLFIWVNGGLCSDLTRKICLTGTDEALERWNTSSLKLRMWFCRVMMHAMVRKSNKPVPVPL